MAEIRSPSTTLVAKLSGRRTFIIDSSKRHLPPSKFPMGSILSTILQSNSATASVAFSPDGTLLATGSMDATTRLWRTTDGVCIAQLSGHSDIVAALAFSPDGVLLATGSDDTTTVLRRVADGTVLARLIGHASYVYSVAFSHDGALLATGSDDKTAKLWRVTDGVCTATLSGHRSNINSVTFSPDGTMLATGSSDNMTKLWRITDGVCAKTLAGHKDSVTSVAFSFDGRLLATSSYDKTIKLWRVADGVCTGNLVGHSDKVRSIALSPDGAVLASTGADKTTKLWRVADSVCTATLAGHDDVVMCVVFSPDGTQLATCSIDMATMLWHIGDGVCTATLAGHEDNVTTIAFSPDGTLFATGGDDQMTKLWRVADNVCTATLAGHSGTVCSVAFSPDGALLATGSIDCTLKLWRVADGVCTATFDGHSGYMTSVAFSPDGALLATGSDDQTAKLWRVADGVCTATLSGHKKTVNCVAFNPSGLMLATSSDDNTAKLWRVADGVCSGTLEGHKDKVTSVAFSPDGMLLATASNDKTTKLWSVTDGVCTSTLAGHKSKVICVAFSSCGELLATGSDKITRLWRVADGMCAATLGGHLDLVSSVAFSPDGALLATGSNDKTAKMWRVADGVCTAVFAGHTDMVKSAALSASGSLLATLGASGSCFVWSLKTQECIGQASVETLESGELTFLSSDDRSCVLEFRGVVEVNVFVVNLSPSFLQQATVKTKRSTPSFPHSGLREIVEERCIGGGSSCVVLRCKWRGRTLAFKRYHPDIITQIARELAIVPHLQHPNILRVVAIVDSPGDGDDAPTVAGLLMELALCSLGSVLLSSSPTSPATILRWLHEIAEGLEFAHECRVIHSDIKPHNIMLVGNELEHAVAKVTDFGSASIFSTVGTATKTVRGTSMFIAPEYATGVTGPTRASDVFSFGMTMWHALVPLGTDHGLGKLDIHMTLALNNGKRPPLTAIDPSLAHLIEQCWATEPSARPSMIEVEQVLRHFVPGVSSVPQPRSCPSMLLWSTVLHSFSGVEAACQALEYQQHGRDALFFSANLDSANPCHQLVCTIAGSFANNKVQRIVMVGTDAPTANCFIKLHNAEVNSRAVNPALRVENPKDRASVAGLERLTRSFIPVVTALGEPQPFARLLFAWYGTSPEKVAAVCRDGPRSLRTTDCGYFGAGSYFALEAAYALRYSSPDDVSGESAVILFLVSVSQAKVITVEGDYRRNEANPHLQGFSQYYSGSRETAVALASKCDAHFIPVKDYGCTHPLTGQTTCRDVDYQAVDESSGTAEAHELVVGSHHRCIPIAVVYTK